MPIELSISTPFWSAVAVATLLLTIVVRSRPRGVALLSFSLGVLSLVVASGEPRIVLERRPRVVAMLDSSPSTRSADYRQNYAAQLSTLLPDVVPELIHFGATNTISPSVSADTDLPADRTVFAPQSADAIILFSDGQFELPPFAPPIYAVLDGGLRDARDARIELMSTNGALADVTTTSSYSGAVLDLGSTNTFQIPIGTSTHSVALLPGRALDAKLSPDPWPENNAGSLAVPAVDRSILWIGSGAPSGFAQIDASTVIDVRSMLGVAAVVLSNAPAAVVPEASKRSLEQYVRNLGGTLIIDGGASAFAAGGWTGTAVDAISPLAASPPSPQRLWVVLIDASGSMAADTSGGTRLDLAAAAARAALSRLPPNDRALVGTFAERLAWLTSGPAEVRLIRDRDLAPPAARGPTNLDEALQSIIREPASLPREVLIITDGETAGELTTNAEQLAAAKIRPSVLLIGPRARALPLLKLVESSGGDVVEESDPTRWISAAQELARIRQNVKMSGGPFDVALKAPIAASLSNARLANETWLRSGATQVGWFNNSTSPAAAMWQLGNGKVLAFAFDAPESMLARTAQQIPAAARDHRFKTRHIRENTETIEVEAADDNAPTNGLQLGVTSSDGRIVPMRQVGPGLYRTAMSRQDTARVVDIRLEGGVVDRIAIPGRHAMEFDAIGLNLECLRELARRTGGAVIDSSQKTALQLPSKRFRYPIGQWLAVFASVCVTGGLLLLARRR